MCGGIAYNLSKIPKGELEKYYSKEEIQKFNEKGELDSYFWSKIPLLPVEKDGKIELMHWGNRSDELKLPKTGWAKKESIDQGKWSYLHPDNINIAADKGYEKGVWFDTKNGGFKGIIVNKDSQERVYMVTKPADQDYLKLTKHDRQPVDKED